jgi:CubicO group peptidase (beta-lactamase class C family)
LNAYYPGKRDDWEKRKPEEVNLDPHMVQEAINFANQHETTRWPRDLTQGVLTSIRGLRCDNGVMLGPTKMRTGVNGLILRHGYIVAEWGDTKRPDMTFSITKSYLSTVAGLAFDQGLIENVHDPVREYVDEDLFDPPHNSKITWHHLLQQTNEWNGSLWDKHYSAGNQQDQLLEPVTPGTRYEYNDVRVNLTALSLVHVWRRPLPRVLKEYVMDPIDASNTWRWYGYRNSWITIDGMQIQSVSGGGHWGGGMQISSRDHARFGYLFLRRGRWKDRQLVSEKWIDMATTPGDVNPLYGYMWHLNPGRKRLPSAPESSFMATGGSANRIWVDREHDLVVVVRWIDGEKYFDGIIQRLLTGIK